MNRKLLRTVMTRCLPALAACVLTTLCMTGCATGRHRLYAGPVRPAEQVAQIKSAAGWQASPVRLLAVDGQRGPNGAWLGYCSQWDDSFRVDVLPGDHTLTVRHVLSATETNLALTASAAHAYLLYATVSGSAGEYVILDQTENRPVTEPNAYPFAVSASAAAPRGCYCAPWWPLAFAVFFGPGPGPGPHYPAPFPGPGSVGVAPGHPGPGGYGGPGYPGNPGGPSGPGYSGNPGGHGGAGNPGGNPGGHGGAGNPGGNAGGHGGPSNQGPGGAGAGPGGGNPGAGAGGAPGGDPHRR
jgi:hypothetical protein